MNNYYSNFQRFDNKGNRLSILGREKDGMLEVFVLKANSKDKFSKNIAKSVYETWFDTDNGEDWKKWLNSFHPKIELIVIENGDTGKYTFKKYCELYYKKQTTILVDNRGETKIQYEYLYNNDGEILNVKNSLKFIK